MNCYDISQVQTFNIRSSGTTHFKRTQATFVAKQFCLSDADYHLSPEFERALLHCKQGKDCEHMFREFGSHLAREATLGGAYVIEASVTADSLTGGNSSRSAIGIALSARMSMAGAAVGFGGGFGGAATGASAAGINANIAIHGEQKTLSTATHKRMCMSTYVTGGVPGKLEDWLTAMEKGNEVWEVIDRNPQHFRCIYIEEPN